MKLRILSDLHVEHGEPRHLNAIKQGAEDVVVCAGDVANGATNSLLWLRDKFPDRRIVFVPGNHEYYGECISDADDNLRMFGEALKVDVLINSAVDIDGVEFVGSVLWSDFRSGSGLDHALSRMASERYVNDFRMIRVNDTERLRAHYVETRLFLPAYNFLSDKLDSDNPNQVVITHFAPTLQSVAPQFAGDPITPYFVNDLEDLVKKKPVLWFHGHTHTPFDYSVGGSRVVCNPSGYRGEGAKFEPNLIIELYEL